MSLEFGEIVELLLLCMQILIFEDDDPTSTIAKCKMLPCAIILEGSDDVLFECFIGGSLIADELRLFILATLTCYLWHVPSIKLFLKTNRISTYRSKSIF